MISILNNLPEDYDVILDGLENCLTATGDNVLTINVICKNWIMGTKKLKAKRRKNWKKAFEAYNEQCKQLP